MPPKTFPLVLLFLTFAYSLPASSCEMAPALAYKGIEHDIRVTRTRSPDTKTAEYLKINPMAMIPALEAHGTPIAESVAILEYLEEAYPQKPLLPKDLIKRAQVRQICQVIACGIQPLQNPLVAQRAHPDDPNQQKEWQAFYISKGFNALETMLSRISSNNNFCVGDSLTMADCCLVPQVWNAYERFKVDMSPYPKIMDIYKNLYKLDEVKSCDPSHEL